MENKLEVWQRGPLIGVVSMLQPVAHALLQVGEEVHHIMKDFSDELLWDKPAGVASPAFHLQHIRGVIDRLFTYARKQQLNKEQMHSLSLEGKPEQGALTSKELTEQLDKQINKAIKELMDVKEDSLHEARGVGRKQIPTTLVGLYVHVAEHSMRHLGQLLVTVRILNVAYQKL